MDLSNIGWDSSFKKKFDDLNINTGIPARIVAQNRTNYEIISERGEGFATISGKLEFSIQTRDQYPSVGDWVVAHYPDSSSNAVILSILPRQTILSRKGSFTSKSLPGKGRFEIQVLAANINIVFVVSGLDKELNLRKIERYLTAVWESGAIPVILLNKSDLCNDIESVTNRVEYIALGTPVHAISANTGNGFDALNKYLVKGKTSVFLGSSGVGKSSIINRILGENRQEVQDVREADNRGRHTTTRRELIVLPGGSMVIDSPGLREFQPWDDNAGFEKTFDDIESIAGLCKFNDCRHGSEPGCAVREALEKGEIDEKRFKNYLYIQNESRIVNDRKNAGVKRPYKREWEKNISKYQKELKKAQKRKIQ